MFSILDLSNTERRFKADICNADIHNNKNILFRSIMISLEKSVSP